MAEQYYRDALKQGQKAYRACVAEGRYPYLPVLDDIVPSERSAAGQELGVASIPAEFIVGTKTRGRTNSFAENFMPLLNEGTEFSMKWEKLCQAHLEEGIHDAVKVYEYLNRYYVEEGNKRVSVLKFFGAVSVPALVIRVLPEKTGDAQTEIYYELVDFYRVSKINYLEFSKKGSYAALTTRMGKAQGEMWTDEERSRFASVYYAFRKAYEAMGGARLTSTVGDALLACIDVYGYQKLCEATPAEMKKAVAEVWEEVRLQQESSPIAVSTAPAEEKRESLLKRVLPIPAPVVKAAFLYDKNPRNSGWAYGHEQGRAHAQRVFEGRIETSASFDVMEGDPLEALERAVAEGNKVIFTTSPRLLPASLQAAVKHPEVTIFNCALNQSHRYIRTYYARIYEAKFIIGAIAGAMAEGADVGYICDYPIYGQVAGVNAFALGVQMVNPGAKVVLEWSSVGGRRAAEKRLNEKGIQLVSSQDLTREASGRFGVVGLTRRDKDGQHLLASPLWKWDVYYEELLRRILDRTVKSEYEASSKALNYYWGMSSGVVDVYWSPELPEGVQKLAGYLKYGIGSGLFSPFTTPVRRQSGEPVEADGRELTTEMIINMDYLVDNVSGTIPAYTVLTEIGKATVDMMGVEPSTKKAVPTN